MIIHGYCALVRLAPLTAALAVRPDAALTFLSPPESLLWARCATLKRRAEFLGGRIAAKLAINLARAAAGEPARHWRDVAVLPAKSGAPFCEAGPGAPVAVSICHSRSRALALASAAARRVAVDLEDEGSRVRLIPDLFGDLELATLASGAAARAAWTLKEVFAKLTGEGLGGAPHRIPVIGGDGRLWLIPPAARRLPGAPLFATGTRGPLSLSMAFAAEAPPGPSSPFEPHS